MRLISLVHRLSQPGAAPPLVVPIAIALVALALWAAPATGQAPSGDSMQPLVHTLRFDDARHHYVDVEVRVPTGSRPPTERAHVDLAMAVWTPGSYLVREYARHLEGLTAETPAGDPLPVSKVRKNRWRVETGATGEKTGAPTEVVVRYRLYCREMTVRTNFVDGSFALLNGAATFLALVAPDGPTGGPDAGRIEIHRPHVVRVVPDSGWRHVISALPEAPGEGPNAFYASDFDTLVDSPLYAGNAVVHRFEVDGAPHLLVNEGEQVGDVWDGPRSAADAATIVQTQLDFWGVRPYDRYVFFNLITEARGGLEHKGSTVLMTSRWRARQEKEYRGWLALVSHEFFHTWNVKRLRPVELGPFDYEREVHTESLWIAEGVTSYYDDLLLRRAGLLTREQYLEKLSEAIERLQTTPGRRVMDLTDASFDAWIKQYRPDENSVNTAVSYYNKGQIVAWLLDAEIRRRTGGERSLDDVLRAAWQQFSGKRGFRHDELLALATELAGSDLGDLGPFFKTTLETGEELSYEAALDWYGLRFGGPEPEEGEEGDGKGDDEEEPAGWLGAETELHDGRLTVREVRRDTPAWEAGLQVEDELIAFDGFRIPPQGLEERLKAYELGDEVTLLVARRERLVELPLTFGETPDEDRWKLAVRSDATDEQTERLGAWLH